MRTTSLLACLAGLALVAGCYNPKVNNGGFACSPTDTPPCPSGYYCVSGLCVDSPSAVVPTQDMTMTTGTGGNGTGGSDGGDTSTDMAHAAVDMAMPPGSDMATAPMCKAQGEACNSNADCCNMVCFPGPGLCVI